MALPLHANDGYLWAIEPNGRVVCLDHQGFGHPAEPEADPLVIFAVLTKGADRYAELRALIPNAPAGARSCKSCGGAGTQAHQGVAQGCAACSGLGWSRQS